MKLFPVQNKSQLENNSTHNLNPNSRFASTFLSQQFHPPRSSPLAKQSKYLFCCFGDLEFRIILEFFCKCQFNQKIIKIEISNKKKKLKINKNPPNPSPDLQNQDPTFPDSDSKSPRSSSCSNPNTSLYSKERASPNS